MTTLATRCGLAALLLTVAACAGETDRRFVVNRDGGGGAPLTDDSGQLGPAPSKDDSGSVCLESHFNVSETQETFTVPAGARYMHVKAWGAGGNGEGQCVPDDDGGLGGYSEAVFAVTPGEPLIIIVGKRGRAGLAGEDLMRFGFGHWGGGGLSGVFRGPDLITAKDAGKALIVAGGGGGATAPGCHPGGTGNYPSAGGASSMQGSEGGDGVNGGAGGYEGGAGGAKGAPGAGGTGFIAKEALQSRMLYAEPKSGKPPKTDDPDYDGSAGKTETSGQVILRFVCDVPVLQ